MRACPVRWTVNASRIGLVFCAITLVNAAGCGGLGGPHGGADNLPTQGIGPYKLLSVDLDTPLDEPIVMSELTADLLAPAILDGDRLAERGDPLLVWAERRADEGATTIVHASIDPLFVETTPPAQQSLAPTEAWEGTRVGAPTVIRRGARILLFYEGGSAGAIGRAVSTDGGQTFTREPTTPVANGVFAPTVVGLPGGSTGLAMYASRPGTFGSEIVLLTSSDEGVTWSTPDVVLSPTGMLGDAAVFPDGGSSDGGALFLDAAVPADGGAATFDAASLEDPCAFGPDSPTGRDYIGLFYVGRSASGERSIGYAASFDGRNFLRAMESPVLEPGRPDEDQPAIRRESSRGVMLFTDHSSRRLKIAVAIHVQL